MTAFDGDGANPGEQHFRAGEYLVQGGIVRGRLICRGYICGFHDMASVAACEPACLSSPRRSTAAFVEDHLHRCPYRRTPIFHLPQRDPDFEMLDICLKIGIGQKPIYTLVQLFFGSLGSDCNWVEQLAECLRGRQMVPALTVPVQSLLHQFSPGFRDQGQIGKLFPPWMPHCQTPIPGSMTHTRPIGGGRTQPSMSVINDAFLYFERQVIEGGSGVLCVA